MRTDVPSPSQMRGGRFWCEATIAHPVTGSITLPVGEGSRIWHADQWPSEQISGLTVPRKWEGKDLLSGVVGSEGHRVTIKCFAQNLARSWEWVIGTYLVTQALPDGPAIRMNAVLLSQLVDDHQGKVAEPVNKASTIQMVISRLLNADRVTAWLEPGLGQSRVPVGYTIGVDRGEAFQELLTAWGAFVVASPVADLGIFRSPVGEVTEPVVAFVEGGPAGTVVDAPLELDRSQITNHVVVQVKDQPQVAEAFQRDGRYGVDVFGWRTQRIETESVSRIAEAQLVSRAELRKGLLRAVTVPVEAVVDWRVGPYDGVRLESEAVSGLGRVTGFDVPLTSSGTAVFDVGLEV